MQTPLKINKHKYELNQIMQFILIDLCNADILGYNKSSDHYWCKKYDTLSCILHIELHINVEGLLSISPKIYSQSELNAFLYDLSESIDMCQTSNFIKYLYLDNINPK